MNNKVKLKYLNAHQSKTKLIIDPESHLENNRFNDGKCDNKGRFYSGSMNEKEEEAKAADKIEDILPDYFLRTAHHIKPDKRVEIQSMIQRYIDHSISSTINLPEDVQPEVISDIYLKAWKKNLKGVTIYRDGSRFPILSTEEEITEFQRVKENEFKISVEGNQIITANGEEIIKLPDGTLTTVYHYLKNSDLAIEEVLNNPEFEEIKT